MSNKIGINLLYINPKLAGGSVTYAIKLIQQLAILDNTNNYIIYLNNDCKSLSFEVGRNFSFRFLNFNYTSVYKRYFWEQIILPYYTYKDKIQLLHSLGYVSPLLTVIPKIVSILDINYKGHSNNMSFHKRILLGLMVNLSAIFCKRIITISEFSKEQIVKFTPANNEKVLVTLLSGTDDNFSPQKSEVLSKYKINSQYLVAFSSPSPHKNISRLIEAYKLISKSHPNLELVLIGHQSKNNELLSQIDRNGLSGKIIFTGFVPDEDLFSLINSAKVFVFPSLYEGFGIPLLDAQQCNVPVVSSNAGSLPEIGGDSVLYFNPNDTIDISNKILEILDHDNIAENLKIKGLINRNRFSWLKTATQTMELYKELIP